jgi:NAD(P)-dependent dehydrogenase (short-subunit alcohol dehydrogenase family)
MGTLEGRVAVVTGAGRGIGAGIARLLAAEGAAVVVNDLGVSLDGKLSDSSPANMVVDEISSAGGTALADRSDISEVTAAEALVHTAIDKFGGLDVVVNVAGIVRDRMIFNMSEEDWDAVIRVHLKGHFNVTRPAASFWREQRNPSGHYRLINFTSGSGLYGGAGQPNYAAAKMGIVGFTYSCANALARYGVTANAISPGANTRMTENLSADQKPAGLPSDMSPENVAPIVAYLAGTRSDWLTGQVIGARGYEVTLYNKPAPLRTLVSESPWQVDRLGELVEQSFQSVLSGDSR